MIDTILTILATSIYLPAVAGFVRDIRNTPTSPVQTAQHRSRQFLLGCLSLELVSTLAFPSVMYIAGVLTVFALLVYCIVQRPKLRFNSLLVVSLLYITWFAVSLLWSGNKGNGAMVLFTQCLPIVLAALISSAISISRDEISKLLRTFCYSAYIFAALIAVSWAASSYELHLSPSDWSIMQKTYICGLSQYQWLFRFLGGHITGYLHPSYNLLPMFFAVIAASWLCKGGRAIQHLLWIFLWLCAFAATLLTQSRMGILYSVIILLTNCLYMPSNTRRRFAYTAVAASAILISGAFTHDFWQQYGSDMARETMNDYAVRYIKTKPLTGAGAGNMNPLEICRTIGETYWPNYGQLPTEGEIRQWPVHTNMRPHNQWLADWVHAGVAAALLTLMLYICVIARCYEDKNYWGMAFILIFTIFSLLEPPLYIGKGLYLFCSVSCLIFASSRPGENRTKEQGHKNKDIRTSVQRI